MMNLLNRNMLIGFSVVVALSNSVTAYFTASYKDGQFAKYKHAQEIQTTNLLTKINTDNSSYIENMRKISKDFYNYKQQRDNDSRRLQKQVKDYVKAKRENGPLNRCISRDSVSIVAAIAKRRPMSNFRLKRGKDQHKPKTFRNTKRIAGTGNLGLGRTNDGNSLRVMGVDVLRSI